MVALRMKTLRATGPSLRLENQRLGGSIPRRLGSVQAARPWDAPATIVGSALGSGVQGTPSTAEDETLYPALFKQRGAF
jgi:hypothetical protein